MSEIFDGLDIYFALRRVGELVELLGYEPEPESLKLFFPLPIDDFQQARYIGWRFMIDDNLFGERVFSHCVYEEIDKARVVLKILNSVAFFVGLKDRAECDFINQAMFANKFREGNDHLLKTLLKMEWRRIWRKLKSILSLRFSRSSGGILEKYQRD